MWGLMLGAILLTVNRAEALLVDLQRSDLEHGEELTTQFLASDGVTFSAEELGSGDPRAVIIFDSSEEGTADSDLEGPPPDADLWDGGNLPNDTQVGNLFIVQEDSETDTTTDGDGNTVYTNPNDEGSGGVSITIDFGRDLKAFGFDAVDFETESSSPYSEIRFFKDGTEISDPIEFPDFVAGGDYDQGAEEGDHHLNRIAPIHVSELQNLKSGFDSFDTVVFELQGSGGFTRLTPEPTASVLFLLAAACCLGFRRRK
jgi:hypothetical protein